MRRPSFARFRASFISALILSAEIPISFSDFLSAAYECGYESASGFREAFQREFGVAPGKVRSHD